MRTSNAMSGVGPRWWFGAPFIAFAYTLVTPRFVPDIVGWPQQLPGEQVAILRWLVGLVIGVALLTTWRLVRWATHAPNT